MRLTLHGPVRHDHMSVGWADCHSHHRILAQHYADLIQFGWPPSCIQAYLLTMLCMSLVKLIIFLKPQERLKQNFPCSVGHLLLC